MVRIVKFGVLCYLMFAFVNLTYSQACGKPFNIKFVSKTTTTVDLSWSDVNAAPLGYEIELVKRGDVRTGIPTLPLITAKSIKITSLIPSSSYELYIRTVCNSGKSDWNVAIPFTTNLEIPTACNINIPLKDNGIETLILDIPQVSNPNLILGKNIFLKSVSVILEHDWPADLKLILESPQGQQLVLANHKGTVTDDFGNINDSTCREVTTFSPEACYELSDSKPPFLGIFKPDGDIRQWQPDTLSKGVWKLISFDRAIKDAGTLRYLDIKFTTEDCQVPDDFVILNTGTNEVTIGWNHEPPCNTVRIQILENGIPKDTIFYPCIEEKFTIKDLNPNTSYSFSIVNICDFENLSLVSCEAKTNTSCEPVSVVESFDKSDICSEDCSSECSISSDTWYNVNDDDNIDWIVWQGETNTENTGPKADINEGGKYIYIESNPQLCGENKKVVLQSRCFKVLSNPSGCDMSFYYHMYGKDIESLSLEVSLDGGNMWQTLFTKKGDQGDQWNRVTLSLKDYHDQIAQFRFIAKTGLGALGDIALDQIEFYKSTPITSLNTFYKDQDNDGFGSDEIFVNLCTSIAPVGYVAVKGDCNDANKLLYPGAIEIQCNGIDENCNGNNDDQPESNPIRVQSDVIPSLCNGSADGSVFLNISGGNAPYSVKWNDGMQGETVSNLSNGIYYATITDIGGCVVKTPFYEINAVTNLNILLSELKRPTCLGINDGSIGILHNIDFPPYSYLWSNGSTTKNITGVGEGQYAVTVTDANNCFKVLDHIKLNALPSLITNVRSISHPKCYGQQTGAIELITINGVSPYKYTWNTGNTSESLSNISSGDYNCTVSDARGCLTTFSTKITSPQPIEINVISTEDVRCFGETNGSIKTEVNGGKPGYSYLWNKLSETTDDIYNLSAGTYTLTVSDANGCSLVSTPIFIREPQPFVVTLDSIRPATCISGKNGYISISATGGNGGYNYVWRHTQKSTEILDSIQSGNYSVTAYDILGCKSGIPNIDLPYINKNLDVPIALLEDNLCYKDKKGVISAQINDALPPYDFNWSHGVQYFNDQNKDTVFLLPAGIYSLTVTDVYGCVGTSNEILIAEKEPYNFSITQILDNKCAGDSSGSIAIMVNGGMAPINILWNGGLYNGFEINGLASGSFKALILDQNQCRLETDSIVVSSRSDMVLVTDLLNTPTGTSKGRICVSVSGGALPYKYLWSNGNTTMPCIENLGVGNYKLTITDNLGCIQIKEFKIETQTNTSNENIPTIKVYPNPFFDKIYIENLSVISSASISNLEGKILKRLQQSELIQENGLNMDGWLPGMYILGLEVKDVVYRFKIIKID